MTTFSSALDHDHLPDLTVSEEEIENAKSEFWDLPPNQDGTIPVFSKMHSIPEIADALYGKLSDQFYRQRIVHVKSNNVLLLRFRYDYEIDLDRIKTPLDLLGWALHLCGKTWMSTEHLHNFIETVCKIKKFNVHMT
jgi:hypothetical protein